MNTNTKKQDEFLRRALNGENLFLTGEAGTGKSWIVDELLKQMKAAGRKVAAVAPTGVAANNIDGQTIHSFFRIPVGGIMSQDACASKVWKEIRMMWAAVQTLVIDEISMVRPDIMDAMHWTLTKNGCKGGLKSKQIICVGDLFQLPVILDDNEAAILLRTYKGKTFQHSLLHEGINMHTIALDEVVRQSDPEFIAALNMIRRGQKSPYFAQFVHQEPKGVILAPHNATSEQHNTRALEAEKGAAFEFKAQYTGEAKPSDFNLDQLINVKDGCKVMYLTNSKESILRNGTMGVFTSKDDKHMIKVGNVEYEVDPIKLSKKKYVYSNAKDDLELKEIGSIEQMPLKLAYSLSIHKSQGLTFDEITVDLRRPCFVPGQMYVALSRVRTPQGLRILAPERR